MIMIICNTQRIQIHSPTQLTRSPLCALALAFALSLALLLAALAAALLALGAVLRSGRTAENITLFFAQEVSRGCFETPWS